MKIRGLFGIALAAALLPGCLLTDEDDPTPDPIQTDVREARDFLAAYEASLESFDAEAYDALLSTDTDLGREFLFLPMRPLEESWLERPWTRDEESKAITRLFDPPLDVPSLKTLDVDLFVRHGTFDQDGVFIATRSTMIATYHDGNETRFTTRLNFNLAPDENGFLRLFRLREVESPDPGDPGPSFSFTQLKWQLHLFW